MSEQEDKPVEQTPESAPQEAAPETPTPEAAAPAEPAPTQAAPTTATPAAASRQPQSRQPSGRGGGGGGGGGRGGGCGRGQGGRQSRGRGGQRGEEDSGLEETVVKINRCATVVKGGRRFSFSALVVVGDRSGKVGWGFGKANQVPNSIEKAIKAAERGMVSIERVGNTIPHETRGKYGASKVVLVPASPGTGVIAGAAVRAVIEAAGIRDLLTKAYGSVNPVNLVKATFVALDNLRSKQTIESLRGVSVEVQSK